MPSLHLHRSWSLMLIRRELTSSASSAHLVIIQHEVHTVCLSWRLALAPYGIGVNGSHSFCC